jgi:hypothetical protein
MPRVLSCSGSPVAGLATAATMFLAAPSVASTISATTWNNFGSTTVVGNQQLSRANAGTLVQNGSNITVGYTTGYGNGGGGGTQLAGITNLAVDWNSYNPTNALTTGSGQAVGALRIGFGTDNSGAGTGATNLQTITFSQAVVDPYIYLTYAQGGVIYDFSAYTTTVLDSGGVSFSVPASSGAATGRTVTGSFNTDSPNSGFILQLTGSFTQIQFNVDASGRTGIYNSSIMTIVAPLSTSSVPGAGLAGFATVGLAGVFRRRRR